MSPHALVPTSTLGPSSPSSSTPSLLHMYVLRILSKPSSLIDKLEEMDALKLPSNKTGTSSAGSRSSEATDFSSTCSQEAVPRPSYRHGPAPIQHPNPFDHRHLLHSWRSMRPPQSLDRPAQALEPALNLDAYSRDLGWHLVHERVRRPPPPLSRHREPIATDAPRAASTRCTTSPSQPQPSSRP